MAPHAAPWGMATKLSLAQAAVVALWFMASPSQLVCPFLAPNGHRLRHSGCPLSGLERTTDPPG